MPKQEKTIRLDKAVAAQTDYSRKEIKKLASAGKILVNGIATRSPDLHIDLTVDQVVVDGRALRLTQYSYLMLHKPQGVVCATSDSALPTVLDLVPPQLMRSGLFPAGRLDKDTEGFVLITNDGELAHRILAPKSHVPKTYLAVLDKPFDQAVIDAFAEGVLLRPEREREERKLDKSNRDANEQSGAATLRCMPALLTPDAGDFTRARVVIRQGMYHQIKRMFGAFGLTVVGLRRETIGGLALDAQLAPGECRELTATELVQLTEGED